MEGRAEGCCPSDGQSRGSSAGLSSTARHSLGLVDATKLAIDVIVGWSYSRVDESSVSSRLTRLFANSVAAIESSPASASGDSEAIVVLWRSYSTSEISSSTPVNARGAACRADSTFGRASETTARRTRAKRGADGTDGTVDRESASTSGTRWSRNIASLMRCEIPSFCTEGRVLARATETDRRKSVTSATRGRSRRLEARLRDQSWMRPVAGVAAVRPVVRAGEAMEDPNSPKRAVPGTELLVIVPNLP